MFLDLKGQLAPRVLRVLPDFKGQKGRKVPKAFPDLKGQRGPKVPRVFPVLKGQKDRKVLRVFPVLKGQRDPKVLKAIPVLKGLRALRVLPLPSVCYPPTPPPRRACHPAAPWNLTATGCSTELTFPTPREAAPSPLPSPVCTWSHSTVS